MDHSDVTVAAIMRDNPYRLSALSTPDKAKALALGAAGGVAGAASGNLLAKAAGGGKMARVTAAVVGVVAASTAVTAVVAGMVKQAFRFTFQGFSRAMPPTPKSRARFIGQAVALAVREKRGHGFAPIIRELRDKGFEREAILLENHWAKHSQDEFTQAMDNWLDELATRSPETIKHIKRQSVVMALASREFTHGMPPAERDATLVQGMIAAAAHDIGKLSLDPELLHKPTRIDTPVLEQLIADYARNTPDYPEKAEHLEFLRLLNGGRIPMDETARGTDIYPVADILRQITEQPLLGEPGFASEALKFSCRAHYDNIRQRALEAGVAWLPADQESALLNHGRRGTLTQEECTIIGEHDTIGMEMLRTIAPSQGVAVPPALIDMRPDAPPMDDARLTTLREWIKLSDMLEATTGQRAYNRDNGKNLNIAEAMQVLADAAAHGHLGTQVLAQCQAAQLAEQYGALYRDIPKARGDHPQPVVQAKHAHDEKIKHAPQPGPAHPKH